MESVAVGSIRTPTAEMFYRVTTMYSQTLGTARGDWTADTASMGYLGGAPIIGALLAPVLAA
jgi:uncharacterized membrane-anchored protein